MEGTGKVNDEGQQKFLRSKAQWGQSPLELA